MSIETKNRAVQALRDQAAQVAAELARAEEELNRAKQARVDEPAAGSRILIEVVFPGTQDQVYTYLALRTDNPRQFGANWYVTGQSGKKTWDEVLKLVERGEYTVHNLVFLKL